MYAIAFDLDKAKLEASYGKPSWNNAYKDIETVLTGHGFSRQQGSVYFGDATVNAVTCVMAIMDLTTRHPWFAASAKDVRMLRVEDNNDLKPAIIRAADQSKSTAKPAA
jgi:virulence-associated protein VapD